MQITTQKVYKNLVFLNVNATTFNSCFTNELIIIIICVGVREN